MMVHGLDRFSGWLSRLTVITAAAMAVVMIASLSIEVFFRFALRHSLSWSEELALLMFTWIVLLLGSVGVREGFHVRVSLLIDLLPAGARLVLERLILALLMLFGLAMAYSGWDMVARNWDQVAPATRYPLPFMYGAVPVMGLLIVLHASVRLVQPQAGKPTDRDGFE
jgi:TRAP-type C4-dicarboxylate transport system permease small subunit